MVEQDPLAEGPLRDDLIATVRRRQGMPSKIPPLERFLDGHPEKH